MMQLSHTHDGAATGGRLSGRAQTHMARWNRFSRQPWAVFSSMGKEVRIGVLAVSMLSSVSLKTMAHTRDAMQNATSEEVSADTLSRDLDEIEVCSSRAPLSGKTAPRLVAVVQADEMQSHAAAGVNALLGGVASVDVRQRGQGDVQADYSVHGGNFDQLTLLLNGLNLTSPHTGHLSADFPVAPGELSRVEVVTGPAARLFGASALTGAVHLVTRLDTLAAQRGRVHVYGGSYGYAGVEASYIPTATFDASTTLTQHLAASYSRSDGATDNSDYSSAKAFYRALLQCGRTEVDGTLGYSYKQYGANTFYGASSQDQWESNEHRLGALRLHTPLTAHLSLTASAAWNRWYDHYQWHRGSNVAGNFHRADAADVHLGLDHSTAHHRSHLSYEGRYEAIRSTKLGHLDDSSQWKAIGGLDDIDTLRYTHSDARMLHHVYAEHDILLPLGITMSAGLLATFYDGDHLRFCPGIDVAYRPTSHQSYFFSWGTALRLPTFTDLYYSGVNVVGTDNLLPERSQEWSLGGRWFGTGWQAEAEAFMARRTDMIDWVIYSSEPDGKTFRATNFRLTGGGLLGKYTLLPRAYYAHHPLSRLMVSAAWLDFSSRYPQSIVSSKYAMHYLRHKVVAEVETSYHERYFAQLTWRYFGRTGQSNPSYALTDLHLSYRLPRLMLYAEVTNLFGKHYYEYVFIEQPGRLFSCGLQYRF